jgi:Amino acid permease
MLTVLGGRWGGSFGVGGLFAAASLVFFAFIGFDIVATAAAETRNAHKAVPRGILGALVPITVLYVALSLVLTGMVDYTTLATRPDGTTATLASAFALNGVEWAVVVISLGALTGLTTVVLVAMLGQTRVLFAMSRDGLLPRHLARINSAGVPARITRSSAPRWRSLLRSHRPTPGGDGQRRDNVRVRARVGRCDHSAAHPPRTAARIPHPHDAADPDLVCARMPMADDQT